MILAAGMAVVVGSISTSQLAVAQAERRSTATHLAASLLDRAVAEALPVPASGEQRNRGAVYQWRVETEEESADATLRRLRCTITWRTQGQPHTATLTRYVSTPGKAEVRR